MVDTDKIYLDHILGAVDRIQLYIEGMDYEKFENDHLKQDGVIRQLEIIGEAARSLSPEFKQKVDLPWKNIIGMRDVAIHEYFEIDLLTVWDTATKDIDELKSKLVPFKP